jgi:hypothetical protein
MRDRDGLEVGGAAASRDDGVATKKLIEKRLGLHRGEVNAEAHVGAAAEGVVEARVSFVFGSFWAES